MTLLESTRDETSAAGSSPREPLSERSYHPQANWREPNPSVERKSAGSDHARLGLVGESAEFRKVLDLVKIVAPTDATVLVQGETGTGKEVVARSLHQLSRRREGPFVQLNCAAIPAHLVESELFGHERGSFTGAIARRAGRFERADSGTLFLDEVGELDLEVQPKLLRVLQESEFERVGGNRTLTCNTRVVAATNRDLADMVDRGTFREDLYYRLSVFPVSVPPLRQRHSDIVELAEYFAEHHYRKLGREFRRIEAESIASLKAHDWPGNVRELQNVIERSVVLSQGPELSVVLSPQRSKSTPPPPTSDAFASDTLASIERAHILSILEKTNWVVGGRHGAAARLGLKRSTLNFRMKKLGIVRSKREADLR